MLLKNNSVKQYVYLSFTTIHLYMSIQTMIQTHYIFQQNNNMVGRKNMDLLFKYKYYVKHTEKLIHLSTVVILQSMF